MTVVCYGSKTQPQLTDTQSVQFNLDQGHSILYDFNFFVLRSQSEFMEGKCPHSLLQGSMGDGLSTLEVRPGWRTANPENYASCFPVLAWSRYTLRCLYLTEFQNYLFNCHQRKRFSRKKKEGEISLFDNLRRPRD